MRSKFSFLRNLHIYMILAGLPFLFLSLVFWISTNIPITENFIISDILYALSLGFVLYLFDLLFPSVGTFLMKIPRHSNGFYYELLDRAHHVVYYNKDSCIFILKNGQYLTTVFNMNDAKKLIQGEKAVHLSTPINFRDENQLDLVRTMMKLPYPKNINNTIINGYSPLICFKEDREYYETLDNNQKLDYIKKNCFDKLDVRAKMKKAFQDA
jgi:hypothetical protein